MGKRVVKNLEAHPKYISLIKKLPDFTPAPPAPPQTNPQAAPQALPQALPQAQPGNTPVPLQPGYAPLPQPLPQERATTAFRPAAQVPRLPGTLDDTTHTSANRTEYRTNTYTGDPGYGPATATDRQEPDPQDQDPTEPATEPGDDLTRPGSPDSEAESKKAAFRSHLGRDPPRTGDVPQPSSGESRDDDFNIRPLSPRLQARNRRVWLRWNAERRSPSSPWIRRPPACFVSKRVTRSVLDSEDLRHGRRRRYGLRSRHNDPTGDHPSRLAPLYRPLPVQTPTRCTSAW
jgi:hypothetical protein